MFRMPRRMGPILWSILSVCWFLQFPCRSCGLSTPKTFKDSPASARYGTDDDDTGTSASQFPQSVLHHEMLLRAIRSGRIYQHEHFLSEAQVQHLLDEIRQLELDGKFVAKGLSNTARRQAQQFSDRQDRSISVVPWFVNALRPTPAESDLGNGSGNGGAAQEAGNAMDWDSAEAIPAKIRRLQRELSQVLGRPTVADPMLDHECYYSQSKVGSFLPRHMDERHEELKGAQGWLHPSRRSLSWLVYLSDPADWDADRNGGALRTFPQPFDSSSGPAARCNSIRSSSHDGNLQVGWLSPKDDNESTVRAVYLDSWFNRASSAAAASAAPPEPHCVLYVVDDERQPQEREHLTRPWLTEALQGMPVPDFLKACAVQDSTPRESDSLLFLTSEWARRFHLIEDRAAWDGGHDPAGSETQDVSPIRGSLVVFDSVQLPHEVREIKSGTRRALAGWFHERTQEFPADVYG